MNILVVRFTALGDLVTLDPMFRAIRYFYKDANIDFLTSNLGKGLYEDTPYFSNYIIHKNYSTSISLLRKKKYDLVINLHCNSLSHILVLFLRTRKVVNSAANIWQKLLGKKIKVKDIKETLKNSNISNKRLKEYFDDEYSHVISFPKSSKKTIDTDKKIISISTGSSITWKSKQWGADKYSKLITKLINDGYQVVLVGTNLEEEDAEIIIKNNPLVLNYVNKTNLSELKNILAQSDLYIGNDSGPSHIAAAAGTNTITIFGPTDIKHCVKFAPYKANHVYFKPSEKISCHPCYKGLCPTSLECMNSINVDSLYESSINLLKDDN